MRHIQRGVLTTVLALGFLATSASAQQGGEFEKNVVCARGDTIEAALASVHRHQGLVTINVFGTCTENVVVRRSQVQIRAGEPAGATVTAANPARPVIRMTGTGFLVLDRLTIAGGDTGVLVEFGAQVTLRDSTVTGNRQGIAVEDRGMVRLSSLGGPGTTVSDNTEVAISASGGSHISVSRGAVRNNGFGISLWNGATADIRNAEIAANPGDGVGVHSASIRLQDTTVSGNTFSGVTANGGATIFLHSGTTISGNTRDGVTLTDTSVATKVRVETDVRVTNNGGYGLNCSPSPAVAMIVGFNVQEGVISGNARGNVNCPKSPGPP